MQKDIERDEIDALWPQELRRWIIYKRAEAVGINALRFLNQIVDEIRDRRRARPAYDIRRDFVRDAKGKNRGVPGAGISGPAHRIAGGRSMLGRIQEAKLFVPRDINENFEIMLGGEIEEPLAGHMINTNQVRLELADFLKISLRLFR